MTRPPDQGTTDAPSDPPGANAADPEQAPPRRRVSMRTLLVVGVLVSLLLAGVVSYYASSHPDGLLSVAGREGFLGSAKNHASSESPFAEYATRGVQNARLSGGIAGVVGLAVVGAIAGGLFMALRRRDRDQQGD